MSKNMQWTPEVVKRFWNHVADRDNPEEYFTYQFGSNISKTFSQFIQDNSCVLDYGCGNGFLIGHIINNFNNGIVYGADISKSSLILVNERYTSETRFKGAFLPQDLIAMNEKFDAIMLVETIEHLDDITLDEVFDNIKSLLRQEAILVITTPNNEVLTESEVYCPSCDHVFHRWQHVRKWDNIKNSKDNLPGFLINRGFSIDHVIETDFSFNSKSPIHWSKYIVKKILGYQASPHLVVIAKKNK